MFHTIGFLFGAILSFFRTRQSLLLENLALRQQLTVLKRKYPRPGLAALDRLFWVLARRFWSGWKRALIVVSPETVVRWHRSGFALYWRAISRARRVIGRRRLSREIRDLIFRMVAENPTWGAPRIHGELLMLGFEVSERTISRWMRRAPRDSEPAKRWLTFLRNHREALAAMDFFTVPTITFSVLYGFFIISHDRRQILHFNVTRHPTSAWIVQQLREAFPYQTAPKYLIFDWDAKYGREVPLTARSMNIMCIRPSFQSPWQKRGGRALGRELSARSAGPCHRRRRAALEAPAHRLRCLLPRRPDTSRAEQGNSGGKGSRDESRSGDRTPTTRWPASSLRAGRLVADAFRIFPTTLHGRAILRLYRSAISSRSLLRIRNLAIARLLASMTLRDSGADIVLAKDSG